MLSFEQHSLSLRWICETWVRCDFEIGFSVLARSESLWSSKNDVTDPHCITQNKDPVGHFIARTEVTVLTVSLKTKSLSLAASLEMKTSVPHCITKYEGTVSHGILRTEVTISCCITRNKVPFPSCIIANEDSIAACIMRIQVDVPRCIIRIEGRVTSSTTGYEVCSSLHHHN